MIVAARAGYLLAGAPVSTDAAGRAVLLGLLGLGYAIAVDRSDALRRYLQVGGPAQVWTSHTPMWTFAGALILPPVWALAVVVIVHGNVLVRGWSRRGVVTRRVVLTACSTALGVLAAIGVGGLAHRTHLGHSHSGSLIVAGQLLAYALSSLLPEFVAARLLDGGKARRSTRRDTRRDTHRDARRAAVPGWRALGVELTTLVLGVVTAQIVVNAPWLSPVIPLLAAVRQRSILVHQLTVAAHTDAKTGLLNASAWRAGAVEELRRARHEQVHVALLVIDLDHFKRLNDTQGHLRGDVALQAVAGALRATLRSSDLIGRFGGEEFVALLPGADRTAAAAVAERVRRTIRHECAELGLDLTASLGVAGYPDDGTDLDRLIQAADAALYVAKSSGRNRVEQADPPALSG